MPLWIASNQGKRKDATSPFGATLQWCGYLGALLFAAELVCEVASLGFGRTSLPSECKPGASSAKGFA